MGPTIDRLDELMGSWSGSLLRASWQGGLAIAAVWMLIRFRPALPPRVACWAWRLIDLKLIVALVWATPVLLPLLPPSAPPEPTPARIASRGDRPAEAGASASLPIAAEQRPAAFALPRPGLAGVVLVVWLAGAVGAAIVAASDWRALSRLRRSCLPVPSPHLRAVVIELAHALGLRGVPELRTGPGVAWPMLIGASRPAILLPSALVDDPCSSASIRAVLAHELAHIRRGDLWWSLLEGLVRMLFFFHPLVWLAQRQAIAAREAACDALALGASGVKPSEYGRILLDIAAGGLERPLREAAILSMAGSADSLKRRLNAMKTLQQPTRRQLLSWAFALLVLGAAGTVPWQVVPRAALAQAPPAAVPPRAPSRDAQPAAAIWPEDQLKLAEARLKVAEAERKVADARVEKAKAEAGSAVAERKYRTREKDRMNALVAQRAVPAQLLDEEADRLRTAQAGERAAEQEVAKTRAALDAATADVREAEALRDIARLALQDKPDASAKKPLTEAQARLRAARLARARAERDLAQADVARAEANRQKADATVAYRSKERERIRELVEKGLVEPRILDQQTNTEKTVREAQREAQTAGERARAQLKAAAARLLQLEAQPDADHGPVSPPRAPRTP